MTIGHSREADADVEMAFAKDGKILALRGEIFCNIGAYMRPNGTTPVRNAAQFITGPYKVENFSIRSHAVATNKTPAGTYRGPGRYESCFFFERMMDKAAVEARHRPARDPPPEPHPARRDALQDGQDRTGGGLGRDVSSTAATITQCFDAVVKEARLGGEGEARRQARRRALSRHRHRGVRRGRRVGSARACADGVAGRRPGAAGGRLVEHRPGHRDDLRADRRRCAGDHASTRSRSCTARRRC